MISDPLVVYFVLGALTVVLVGALMSALRQPMITGYLLAGLLLGPHGLRMVEDQAPVANLGAIGVVILLFFIGTEVSPRAFVSRWRVAIFGTSLQIVVSLACVALLGMAVDWSVARIVLLGFVISLSCTAIAVDHLKSRGQLETRIGQDTLMILITQDVAVIPMLIVLGLFAGQGTDASMIAMQIAGGVGICALLAWVIRHDSFEIPLINRVAGNPEMQVFLALVLCFGLAWLTGQLHLSTALGAFVAGIIVGQSRNVAWVLPQLHSLRVVFVAIFFASIGMLIDLDLLRRMWKEILALVLLIFLTNTIINALVLRMLERDWRESLFGAALLAHVGEFSFVLAAIGYNTGIIFFEGYQITIVVIAISLALGPAWVMAIQRLLRVLPPAPPPSPGADTCPPPAGSPPSAG